MAFADPRVGSLLFMFTSGCGVSAGVQADALADFGNIRSALWLEFDIQDEGADARSHAMVLSTAPHLCADLQAMVQPMADAHQVFQDDTNANAADPNAQCEAERTYRNSIADLTDVWFEDDFSVLSISLRDADELQEVPPPEGDFQWGFDEGAQYFYADLNHFTANPDRVIADAMSCDAQWVEEAESRADSAQSTWHASSGTAIASLKGDAKYLVELEADLLDEDATDAGALSAHGTFTHCLVSVDGLAELSF
ncbi:MAG: hypothetical protein GWP91_08640 [Rhodobacterales bacterium]|nr:hypothetical protein [Rhodobacterales bacterium]